MTEVVKLHTKFKKNFLWIEPRVFSRWEAWLDLFTSVIETDKNGNGVVVINVDKISEWWGWSVDKVYYFLKLLQDEKMVSTSSPVISKFSDTIIKLNIINYEKYQGFGAPDVPSQFKPMKPSKTDTKAYRALVAVWADRWQKKYGTPPVVHWGVSIKMAKNLLNQTTMAEIDKAMGRFFQDESEYLRKDKHSIQMFASRINRYLVSEESNIGRTR